jgi:hypothetical protein
MDGRWLMALHLLTPSLLNGCLKADLQQSFMFLASE